MPRQKDLETPFEGDSKLDASAIQKLSTLGDVSRWLLKVGKEGGIDLPRASAVMWRRLSEAGLASRRGRLRQERVAEELCKNCEPLRSVSELAPLATTPSVAYAQLLAALKGRVQGLHPLRLASIIAWLYEDPAEFAGRYRAADLDREAAEPSSKAKANVPVLEAKRIEFLQLIKSGESTTASARKVGVEVATGQAWAAVEGFASPRRASIVRDQLRRMLIAKLRRGEDTLDASREFKISASSVTRILRTEVGLHEAWKRARQEGARRARRASWSGALERLGHSAKVARRAEPATYAWLYRNDRAWLLAQNGAHERARSNNSSIDWKQRDVVLSVAVLRAAEEISSAGMRQIRLIDLVEAVPSLKQKLDQLGKMPLTERALRMVVLRRPKAQDDLFQ